LFKKVLSASLEVFIEVGIRLLTGSLFKSSTIGSQPGTFLKLDKVERTERPDRLQGAQILRNEAYMEVRRNKPPAKPGRDEG